MPKGQRTKLILHQSLPFKNTHTWELRCQCTTRIEDHWQAHYRCSKYTYWLIHWHELGSVKEAPDFFLSSKIAFEDTNTHLNSWQIWRPIVSSLLAPLPALPPWFCDLGMITLCVNRLFKVLFTSRVVALLRSIWVTIAKWGMGGSTRLLGFWVMEVDC